MSLISNPASANLSSSKLNTLAQAAMSCSIDPPSTASSSSTRRDSGYQAHEFEKNNAHPDVPDNNNHHNHNHNPYASSLTATTTSTNIGAQYSSSTALQYHSHNHPRHNHENAPSYNPGSHFSRRPGPPHPNSHSVAATNSNNGCDLPSPNSTTIVFGNGDSGGDGGDTNGIGYSNSSNGVGANSGSNSNNGSKGRIFRCTFPNCDMVFSRCEHLARHAR
ncbi:hypothetical protein H4219_005044 [Mycoemilia scoparia]|uniref:C2H2-type domain-containing protein n=1 Tax=Mycoemilia scoparia TaxID=417184 RepID=A0A9W8DQ29_9FUNG|nr:hypothetical protein H4219_005044 [Mycoemilia scoparia]